MGASNTTFAGGSLLALTVLMGASAHAMEPGIAYALIGYACGLIGALIGVLNSKLFRRGPGSAV